MKKYFLIKNPEIFQGQKYLKRKKNYFEGWYFKHTKENQSIAFIPGISITKDKQEAFIQVITNHTSYYFSYPISSFKYSHSPFFIKIGNNYFSKENIYIDIQDPNQKITIFGVVQYSNSQNIKSNFWNPNIMGPFSYLSFMECNHAILSMKAKTLGLIKMNETTLSLEDGTCYIEKDWGTSFPKNYLWCQANNFKNPNVSFMLSIAHIPFTIFSFQGFICSLIIENQEYKFTTYNFSKILKYEYHNNLIHITLKHLDYTLSIYTYCNERKELIAPTNGKMDKIILESISSSIQITLKKKNQIIFQDISKNCGLEYVS